MSAGSLNGGSLAVSKLTIGGQTFTGASGLAGLLGSATGSVATTAGTVNVSVASGAQTGVLTTASTMVLPPAGGGGGNVNATTGVTGTPLVWATGVYQPGALVRDTSVAGANGVYICSATTSATGASSGAPNTLVPSYWNLVVTPGGAGGGIPSLTTTPATAGTGAVSTAFSATLTRNAGSDTAVFTGSAGAMALAINVAPATGSGIAIARGTLTMNAQSAGGTGTVGVLASPTGAQVQLVALSGTLPASFSPTNTWMVSWATDNSATPIAPPAQAPIAPAPPATGTATSATFNCSGAILAGAKLNWVLY
jgi:hypothetical protein